MNRTRCSQIVLLQAYFWSSRGHFPPMQQKSLHISHFYQSFKNRPSALHHTSKAPSQELYLMKKEPIFHRIRKWIFPSITEKNRVKVKKIISLTRYSKGIYYIRVSIWKQNKAFLRLFWIPTFSQAFLGPRQLEILIFGTPSKSTF